MILPVFHLRVAGITGVGHHTQLVKFFFMVFEFELRALWLLGMHSTTWAILSAMTGNSNWKIHVLLHSQCIEVPGSGFFRSSTTFVSFLLPSSVIHSMFATGTLLLVPCSFVFICRTGGLNSGLHACKQALLYCLSHNSSPFSLVVLEMGGSLKLLA
jgi:hypothetical protein